MQLNRIILIGRLTRDPEERHTGDGLETSKFCVAVNRMGKAEGDKPSADFFNVVCFRQTAKFVNAYLRRGNLVAVEGRIQMDEYTDREGAKRVWVEVLADNVQNLMPRGVSDAKPDRDFEDADPGPRRKAEPMAQRGRRSFDDDEDDPFADR